MCSRLLPRAGWLGVVVQPVHAGLLLRRGPAAPVPCSRGGHKNRTGFEYAAGCVPVSFGRWAPTGCDLPIPCPSDSCVSHALHRVCASVMPFTAYARQSYPSPGMRVSHALHWVCASVMPLTGYARQSCLAQGYARQPRPAQGYARQSCPSPGMRISHALCIPIVGISRTQLPQFSSTPMRRATGAARGSVTAMRRPAGLGSTICLSTTRCQSPGNSTGSSA
jgi:hypothetical protein